MPGGYFQLYSCGARSTDPAEVVEGRRRRFRYVTLAAFDRGTNFQSSAVGLLPGPRYVIDTLAVFDPTAGGEIWNVRQLLETLGESAGGACG